MAIFTFIFLGIEYLFVDMISLLVSENTVVLSQNYVLGMSCLGFVLYPLYNRYFKGLSLPYMHRYKCNNYCCFNYNYLFTSYLLDHIYNRTYFIFLGGLGGVTSYKAICILPDQKYLARCVGISYMIGIIL